jgi:putative ABC transport system permease protein
VAGDRTDLAHVRRVAQQVAGKVEKSGRTVAATVVPEPGKRPFVDDIFSGSLLLLGALGFLSLFMSAFLVINTITGLLAQQVRQIGIMKAIGARAGQITGMYLSMVLIFGLLALGIALPLGALVARETAALLAGFINVGFPPFGIPAEVIAVEAAIALLVPALAALYPVIAGTRITVREAIGSYGLGKGRFGHGRIDRLLERLRGPSRPLLLSLRNTFRRKGRLALTLITLTLGGTLFIAVFSVRASLLLTLDDALKYFQYDIEVNFTRPYRIEQIEREAMRVPGIAGAESWGFALMRRLRPDGSESDNLVMIAPPGGTAMLQPTIIAGRWLLPEDRKAIVINTNMLKDEAIAVGDDVELKIYGHKATWRVVGVVRMVGTGSIAFANYDAYARAIGEVGRASALRLVAGKHDMATLVQLKQTLEEHFDRAGLRVGSSAAITDLRAQNEFYFNIIVALLSVMALLLAVVGGLGLMGTMSLNVIERTREIGVLRAIGASNGAILRIVMVEGVLIGVLSWAAGALLALPLGRLLSDAVGYVFFRTALSYTFSPGGALAWLVVIVIVASLASLLPAWSAARLTIRDTLAYE